MSKHPLCAAPTRNHKALGALKVILVSLLLCQKQTQIQRSYGNKFTLWNHQTLGSVWKSSTCSGYSAILSQKELMEASHHCCETLSTAFITALWKRLQAVKPHHHWMIPKRRQLISIWICNFLGFGKYIKRTCYSVQWRCGTIPYTSNNHIFCAT